MDVKLNYYTVCIWHLHVDCVLTAKMIEFTKKTTL